MTSRQARREPGRLSANAMATAIAMFLVTAFAAAGSASPADGPSARLEAALAAPCSTALQLYEAIASDSSISDSLRASAYGRLADHAFAVREYETAHNHYNKASRLHDRRGAFRYRSGLAALENGDTAEAVSSFCELARSGEGPARYEAAMLLGEIALRKNDYTGAMADFQRTGPFVRTNGWSVRATVGKLLCARQLGPADSSDAYEKLLSPYSRTLLEKESLTLSPVGGRESGGAERCFTLQIGAFGSRERADAMKKRHLKKFDGISCMPVSMSERTIYRVWIGDFRTREEAEIFGKERLVPQGLVYRVVAK